GHVDAHRVALPVLEIFAGVLHQCLDLLAVCQADDHLVRVAEIDDALDHAGYAVLAGRLVRLQPHPFGADHDPRLAAGVRLAAAGEQLEVAKAHPAAAIRI